MSEAILIFGLGAVILGVLLFRAIDIIATILAELEPPEDDG